MKCLGSTGMYNTSSILLSLLTTFNRNLGIDDYYFALESVETIANHITALYGAKILAFTKNENELDINLEKESETSSVYIHSSQPGISQLEGPQCERK